MIRRLLPRRRRPAPTRTDVGRAVVAAGTLVTEGDPQGARAAMAPLVADRSGVTESVMLGMILGLADELATYEGRSRHAILQGIGLAVELHDLS